MKKMLLLFLLIIPLLSCEKNETDELPLQFKLVVLDNQGNPTDILKEGEDPTFAFRISNTSDEDFAWYNHCKVFNQPDLYKTYLTTTNDSGEESSIYVGQPFESPVLCEDKPLLIKPGENYYLKLPWSFNSNNDELSPGKYKTEFTISFTVNKQDKFSQSFSEEFKIQ